MEICNQPLYRDLFYPFRPCCKCTEKYTWPIMWRLPVLWFFIIYEKTCRERQNIPTCTEHVSRERGRAHFSHMWGLMWHTCREACWRAVRAPPPTTAIPRPYSNMSRLPIKTSYSPNSLREQSVRPIQAQAAVLQTVQKRSAAAGKRTNSHFDNKVKKWPVRKPQHAPDLKRLVSYCVRGQSWRGLFSSKSLWQRFLFVFACSHLF